MKKKCKRCGHEWHARQDKVKMCPRCKSVNWDENKKAWMPKDPETYQFDTVSWVDLAKALNYQEYKISKQQARAYCVGYAVAKGITDDDIKNLDPQGIGTLIGLW